MARSNEEYIFIFHNANAVLVQAIIANMKTINNKIVVLESNVLF